MSPKHRLIILGAGFSRPAGFPLAADLWREIRETAARFPKDLRAYKFNDDLSHANARAEALRPMLAELRGLSARGIARELNVRQIATPKGKSWSATTVLRVMQRLGPEG